MPFPFDKYPWLNFQELNLAYFIKHFREIFEQWDSLLHEMYDWKDATDADLAEWKSTVETGIASWESGLQQSMEDWKDETEADITAWESATLAALDAWKTATTAVFEQIRTEASASAQAAAGSAASAQTALAGAQAAQAAAEAAAAGIQSELTQISANTENIEILQNALREETGNELIPYVRDGHFIQNDYEPGTVVNVNNPQAFAGYSYAVISVLPGEIFTISGVGGGRARLYSFLDSEYKLINKASPGETRTLYPITAPDNAAYLVLNSERYIGNSYRGTLYKSTLDNNIALTESINDAIYTTNRMTEDYFETLSGNGYLRLNDTIATSGTNFHTSDYIEITDESIFSYSFYAFPNVAHIMFYDASKSPISYITSTGSAAHISGSVKAPDNSAYFRFSISIIGEGATPNDFISYSNLIFIDAISELRAELQAELENEKKVLKDLKWNVLGDSLTANASYADPRYYEAISTRQGGMVTRNYGISGTRIAYVGSYALNAFCERYSSMDDDADIVTVFGGVNDYGQSPPTPIGTFSDTDHATLYGALKILIEGLLTKYPHKMIIFVTPLAPTGYSQAGWPSYGEANSLGFTLLDYSDAIKEVCAFYSIPVVDLSRDAGVTSKIAGEKTYYFVDGLHLNTRGHNKISYLIEDSMVKNAKGKIINTVS